MYDYEKGNERLNDILNSTINIEEKESVPSDDQFTFENGYKTWITEIMSNYDKQIEIGIRGDCVYGIFSTPLQKDIYHIANMSFYINTFINLLNFKINEKTEINPISIGIGVASSEITVIKSGRKYKGINDKIWIGDAVVEASHLSNIANKNWNKPIIFSKLCYDNFINLFKEEKPESYFWFNQITNENKFCYTADIIIDDFRDYINSLNQ